VTFHADADAPRETLDELCQAAMAHSPVFDSVTNGVPVQVALAEPEPAQPTTEAPPPPI